MEETLAPPRWGFWASLAFWSGVALQTVARLRLSRVLASRLRQSAIASRGSHHVPREGGFVLCVNHYHAGLTLDVVSAVLLAAERVRPRISDECTIVVGQRVRQTSRWPSRAVRWVAGRFFERWGANVLRIRTGGGAGAALGVAELRAWRGRAARAPTLVFPEGVAGGELGNMRAGAGRWLCGLGVPVVPVGVWWAAGAWNVVFGAALTWSLRRDLRDLQLGLAMAELLPAKQAPAWVALLEAWRAAHAIADCPPASATEACSVR